MAKEALLKTMDVPALEKRTKKANVSLKKNQENINRELNKIQGIKLPTRVLRRYEKEFGKGKSTFALKTAIFAFALVLLVMLFFQPSVSIYQESNELVIKNNSNREIQNLKVSIINVPIDIFTNENYEYYSKTFASQEEIRIPITTEAIYLASANRQMPALTFAIITRKPSLESNNNENEFDNTSPLKKKLEEDKNANK
jgi:hypothetical protein